MKLLWKVILFSVAILVAAVPAFACHVDPVEPPFVDDFFTGSLNPVAISLFNAPDTCDSDTVTLSAFFGFGMGNLYDLELSQNGNDWTAFNPSSWDILTAYTFEDPQATINLNLRLSDAAGVVSNSADVTFYSEQAQDGGYDWYNWVELNWLNDANGESINVSTLLTALVIPGTGCELGNRHDLVGMASVPIPGTGLLLSIGLLCLIGRRKTQHTD